MTNTTPNNKITEEEAENVSYFFPISEEIVIRKSELQIQLEKFKERIRSSFSVFDILAIVSIWSPLFSADFKELFALTPEEIQTGYTVFAILITAFILCSRFKYFVTMLWTKDNVSTSSEQMSAKILEQCQCKNKK